MIRAKRTPFIFASVLVAFLFVGCTKKVESKPNFIFKPAPNDEAAFKIDGKIFTHKELSEGIENDLYESRLKTYEIQEGRIKLMAIETFVNADSRKGNLSMDEFLDKYIAKVGKPSDKEIMEFISSRNIDPDHVNDQMKERASKFLEMEKKREAVDQWLAEQTRKHTVEIYINKPQRPVFDVAAGDAPFVGPADAKVTIVEFSDFQCPYCSKGREVMDALKKKYGNKIKIAFKNFPLPFHNQAQGAAEAALCAFEQDPKAFWKLHDIMFSDQSKLSKDNLLAHAKSIGLKEDSFRTCIETQKYAQKVAQDMEEGKKVGVKSTPTFFVNGQLVNGAHPIEVFSEIIDQGLAK